MLSELLAIIAPIMISVAVGFIWGKSGQDFPADFISRLVMNIGTPCLIIGAMARVELQPDVIGQVALATALVMTAMGILGWGLVRALKLDIATYLPPLVFPNNGNMGLPLCLFAYGQTGLALALGSFMVMMIATFTVGLLVVATDEGSLWKRMASIARQPVIYAMAIAVVLLVTGTALPRWIGNTLDLLGNIAIPLMTIALGVSLATLRIHSLPRSVFFSLVRMLGGLLLGWLACELLEVTGVARSVVLLQSAMPIAVFNYLLALRYNHNPQEVAAMVLVSTLLAFMGLPFLLLVIL
ncbi:AEC family transporter [Cellvibrio japonicus]|uniref:Auxin Efflux Carrier superfamily n=1 Tax=Cellvibrio japonicus (strain Ueda107) TaxID=498211 RepID=B3PE88_CELJU|nr:AEC family transporter [Cellvibrio japonicus]ACE85249.1 Auxin Efflux Carrier superfamily [Cellvibrio japonicus Ueda107]QEI12128.1 AEC family transporter [Cellvibrio japonicus]QEI15702.1 AEC family transporter [Cellvibrio japonicus]QEI19280.1 AEC family transporter [Cellvibrio japonicus]